MSVCLLDGLLLSGLGRCGGGTLLKTARRSSSNIPFPAHQLAGKSDSLDTACAVDSSLAGSGVCVCVAMSSVGSLDSVCRTFVLRRELPQARWRKKIPARRATIIGTGMVGRRPSSSIADEGWGMR